MEWKRSMPEHLTAGKKEKRLQQISHQSLGGDLQSRILKLKKMPSDHAQFYAAQVVLALEYLHALGIVLRELRPKNIWICKDGYIKIGDLANAVRLTKDTALTEWIYEYKPGTKTNRALGSQPPEVWLAQPYDENVDWWIFGLFLYELYSGSETFPEESVSALYEEQMKQKIFSLHYDTPRWFGKLDKQILKQLLVLNAQDRLGAGPGGITALKQHPWFRGLSWNGLYAGLEKAPWIPSNSYDEMDPGGNFITYSDDGELSTKINNPLPFGYQFQYF
ncbi:cAMP-dependent protein kinase catalytic subunit 2-like [Paramacrobiotus metropolitanus]|uniref:cAMP-dependent protein kinase catalytic subunit 2-like n=1 Tax=Paramacrobiotus metropolitanus TaxID=2943436 RepID=UPI002445A2E3|nr:cAMP-dependent protein kinase catalytic subunit 2-like [Paramacrobiotus metropolitanus]